MDFLKKSFIWLKMREIKFKFLLLPSILGSARSICAALLVPKLLLFAQLVVG